MAHFWMKLMFIWCAHVYGFSDLLISKSATVSITFKVGEVTFVEIPDFFEPGSKINGKASKS